jgi:transcriptional regulator of acetoin/glycerol metabolism
VPAPHSIAGLERAAILDALRETNGNKAQAAARLGLSRFQLYNRLRRYQIAVTPE